jgi:hypothetical protein
VDQFIVAIYTFIHSHYYKLAVMCITFLVILTCRITFENLFCATISIRAGGVHKQVCITLLMSNWRLGGEARGLVIDYILIPLPWFGM